MIRSVLPQAADTTLTLSTQEVGGSLLATSIWELLGYAQGFEFPLGAAFFLGLFFLCSAYARYFRQWRGSRALLNLDPSNMSMQDFKTALFSVRPNNPYRLAGEKLLEEQGRGGTPKSMLDYALRYIRFDHDNYKEIDKYITGVVYIALSLGLLGTLWGIFVLFTSGNRHAASDLVGLGIAVVSTMLAMWVRLILWPLNIFLQSWVRKRYKELSKWAVGIAYGFAREKVPVTAGEEV